jgi:oxygen-independent coproporphyrinogen-3 oxidase
MRPSDMDVEQFIDVIEKEIDIQNKEYDLKQYLVETIFFGGGTPSLLNEKKFTKLCVLLKKHFTLAENYEWSIECNPDSFTQNKALSYLENGVNRLSFGVQSLNDRELKLLGRRHNRERALEVLHEPVLKEFRSIGVDLMFGLPLQNIESFKDTLQSVINIPVVKHLSVYELTINENTPFGRHEKRLSLPDDEEIAMMLQCCEHICNESGFEHYEISNYALPGYRCKHNEVYWQHKNYLGLGPSAHSYMHLYRWSNYSDLKKYKLSCQYGFAPVDFKEEIDAEKMADEIVFLGLRYSNGIDENDFFNKTGKLFRGDHNSEMLMKYIENGYLIYDKPFWKPTEKGMLFADEMARCIG